MPRSFVATTLHSDLKYGDLKMVCKCGDNLNIPDFHRNLDMKPFNFLRCPVLHQSIQYV